MYASDPCMTFDLQVYTRVVPEKTYVYVFPLTLWYLHENKQTLLNATVNFKQHGHENKWYIFLSFDIFRSVSSSNTGMER